MRYKKMAEKDEMAEMDEGVPSGVVELIIAVDLDPSDPEEPLNVNDVQVRSKGGAEGGAFPDYRDLVVRLLEASDVPAQGMSDDELAEAAEQLISGDEMAEDIEEEEEYEYEDEEEEDPDPFSQAGF